MERTQNIILSVIGGGLTSVFTKEYITEILVSVFIGVAVTVISFLIISAIQKHRRKKNGLTQKKTDS